DRHERNILPKLGSMHETRGGSSRGETRGQILDVQSLQADADARAIAVVARPIVGGTGRYMFRMGAAACLVLPRALCHTVAQLAETEQPMARNPETGSPCPRQDIFVVDSLPSLPYHPVMIL